MQRDEFVDNPAEHRVPDLERVLERIASAIRGVRFGSIEVVIQDSRVVQIERTEKFRLDKPGRH